MDHPSQDPIDHASTPVDLEAISRRLQPGALAWLKRLCDVGFEFVDTVCCRAAYRNELVAEGLIERSGGGWLCRATQRGHDLRTMLAASKRAAIVARCSHPSDDRIATLGCPGAYDCRACGYEHRPSLAGAEAAIDAARRPLEIGTVVQRISHRHPGHGKICEITDTRIRVQWLNKSTWIRRSAEGRRWQRVQR